VAAFGFKGSGQQKPAGLMSGGERGRVNLALTLKQGGNLLLLDEPANDLDVETLASLEDALSEFPGCAVITSHDCRSRTCCGNWPAPGASPAPAWNHAQTSSSSSPTTASTWGTCGGKDHWARANAG